MVKTFGEQNREQAVTGFAPINRSQFALVRKSGAVEYWEHSLLEDGDHDLSNLRSMNCGVEQATGIVPLYASNKYDSPSSLIYNANGDFTILKHNTMIDQIARTQVKGPISAVTSCASGGVALGGQENDLNFFDSNTQQSIWSAKNVPFDKLRLRVPVWITAIAIFNPEQTSLSSGAKVLTGTGHKQIRLYDTRADTRPIKSFEIGEYRVTQLQALSDETNVYVSDTVGNVFHYDLRTNRRLHSLKGSDGAIRQMTLYDDEETLVCVGLDRHVRWHDVNTQKHIKSIYLRNRINTCLPIHSADQSLKPRKGKKRSRNSDSDGEEDDDEDMEDVDAFLGSEEDEDDDEQEELLEGEEDDNEDEEIDEEESDENSGSGDSDNDDEGEDSNSDDGNSDDSDT